MSLSSNKLLKLAYYLAEKMHSCQTFINEIILQENSFIICSSIDILSHGFEIQKPQAEGEQLPSKVTEFLACRA
jgi:hypothetical protein